MKQKTCSLDETHRATLNYFGGDELAAKVWMTKYVLKDSYGNIYEQTPRDMHQRIAWELIRIEHSCPNLLSESELTDLVDHFRYIVPQGNPITDVNSNCQIALLSNCFVIGLDGESDLYGNIIRIDEEQV